MDFETWASSHNLSDQTKHRLKEEEYDNLDILKRSTEADLRLLNLKAGQFVALKNAVDNLKEKGATTKEKEASSRFFGFLKSGFDNATNFIKSVGRKDTLKLVETRNGMEIFKLPVTIETEDEVNKIRRCTIGTPSVKQMQKTIMIIGATGSGKSTLVDAFANYIFGSSWDEPRRLQLIDQHSEEKANAEKGQSESQTEWITVYTITDGKSNRLPYTLTLIDTPGFGDTRGIDRDYRLVDQIRALFGNPKKYKVDKLDAVCFVAKAPDQRLTQTQKYIFDSILAIFGTDVGDNILVMITFADGGAAPVLEAIKKAELPHRRCFKFNNSALYSNNGTVPGTEGVKPEDESSALFAKMFWDMGVQALDGFFVFLKQLQPKSLTLTNKVLKHREILQDTVIYLEQQVCTGMVKLDQLREEERIFQLNKQKIQDNKNFKYKVPEVMTEEVKCPLNQHVTHCLDCQHTCHDDCAFSNDADKANCVAMGSNGKCERCKQKCHWSRHRNTGYIFKNKTVMIEKTYDSTLREYQKATGLAKEKINVIAMVKAEYKAIQLEVGMKVKRCREILQELRQIALRPDPLSELEYIDILIEAERREHKPRWEERVAELHKFRDQAVQLKKLQTNDEHLPKI